MAWYQLALLGTPPVGIERELEAKLTEAIESLGMILGDEVSLHTGDSPFCPEEKVASAALYFGEATQIERSDLADLLRKGVPVIPIATEEKNFPTEIPTELQPINGVSLDKYDATQLATLLLECVGLLPKQRRVFISYRRDESRDVAVQLFEALSARLFDVFLDTHGISKGEHFQDQLWHRLCDCDVVLMLDTPNYFNSRWAGAEFSRALAKSVTILRVGWPNHAINKRAQLARDFQLIDSDLMNNTLTEDAIKKVCTQLESARTTSIAIRYRNLTSSVQQGLEKIGGALYGVGLRRRMTLGLPNGSSAFAYPVLGVPSSSTMQEAVIDNAGFKVAIVYDHLGINQHWLIHMNWLEKHIPSVQWVKGSEAAWFFADWED